MQLRSALGIQKNFCTSSGVPTDVSCCYPKVRSSTGILAGKFLSVLAQFLEHEGERQSNPHDLAITAGELQRVRTPKLIGAACHDPHGPVDAAPSMRPATSRSSSFPGRL